MKRILPLLLGAGLLASCGPHTVTNPSAPDLSSDTTRAAPATLNIGSPLRGVIAGQDRDYDYYSFAASAGDKLKITVTAPEGSTLDPYIRLYRAGDWYEVAHDDDNQYAPGLHTRNAEIRFNAVESGTYVLEVTSFKLANNPDAKDNDPKNTYAVQLERR